MSKHASLIFDCPDCDHSLRAELNVGNARMAGENEISCDGCGSNIVISIDIMGDRDE